MASTPPVLLSQECYGVRAEIGRVREDSRLLRSLGTCEGCGDPGESAEDLGLWAREGVPPNGRSGNPPYWAA
ncbi:hypothetical protein GCM10017776_38320 [Streptomyces griseoluteus]|nr:hypothetical protein GCM10017776_38320 [Streptomyces griseoluteus]